MGKTCLAVAIGQLMRGLYAHGVFFIPLRDVSSSEALDRKMKECLLQAFTGAAFHRRQLIDFLREKQCLLILDGCENHLLHNQIRVLVGEILSSAPQVRILATSRLRLNLPEEYVHPLLGLDYTVGSATAVDTGHPLCEAVALFEARARQVNPSFTLTASNLPLVQQLCLQVEGHPLSIELMASATTAHSLPNLLGELKASQRLIHPAQLVMPTEAHNLSVVLEQSWQLLSDEQRLTLCSLVCFKGGFTQAAALHITQKTPEVLSNLVSKSFLHAISEERFMLHEIIQDFVLQKSM